MNVNILSSQEAATLQEMIAASQHIVICCHKSPDGDAIGSSLGWRGFLLSQGKQAQVCMPDMMPDYLQWLPDSQTILRYDKHPAEVQRAVSTSMALVVSTRCRMCLPAVVLVR